MKLNVLLGFLLPQPFPFPLPLCESFECFRFIRCMNWIYCYWSFTTRTFPNWVFKVFKMKPTVFLTLLFARVYFICPIKHLRQSNVFIQQNIWVWELWTLWFQYLPTLFYGMIALFAVNSEWCSEPKYCLVIITVQ